MQRMKLWDLVNTNETINLFAYLYGRWQDEKEYEDINDYLSKIQEKIPQAYKIYKRPFSVICKCDDGDIQIGIKVKGDCITLFGKLV